MKAILLAAGYGRRMRPLTDHEHKTLLTIGGRTIVSRIVDGLLANGITDIVVATGYLAERLRSTLLASHPGARFTFVENRDFATTNNIHSLSLVLEAVEIDDDVLLVESDLIYEASVIERILASPHENVALVDRFRNGMDGTVVTVSGGVITSIIPPHLQGSGFDFSDKYKTLNIYRFSREFCGHAFRKLLSYYTSVIDRSAYYELILGILIYVQKATIHAAVVDGERWAEVDDPNDLEEARYVFDPGARYSILEHACGGAWNLDVVDFCFIRNMYFPGPALLSQLRSGLDRYVTAYGSRQIRLDEKLAYFLLCDPARVALLNGCSQIYPLLRARLAGRRLLLPDPSFGELARLSPDAIRYQDRVGIDTGEIEALSRDADVVVVVNPNNPTGSHVETPWLLDFARRNPEKTVLVDESFLDFAPTPSAIPALEADPLPNLIVIKSLSKCLGVPGLRLGFVYSCDPAFQAWVHAELPIWNANSLAEGFLELILKYRQELERSFERTVEDREAFAAELRTLSSVETVFASAGDFLLVRLRGAARGWEGFPARVMAESSHYLKDATAKMGDGRFYLRLAVRLPEENRSLVRTLGELTGR